MYKLLRNLLFLFPAESVHHFSMSVLRLMCDIPLIQKMLADKYRCPAGYEKSAFGLQFRNPVGLAAGFDKNARYLDALETLGFGFVEIGTVTPLAQAGNPKPRLFRLPKDGALINRMGFNNDGVKEVAVRLKEWRALKPRTANAPRLIIGGNIGKNKQTSNEDAWKDYDICFRALFDCVDYFVVNVSSPNTPGLRALQEKEALKRILLHLQTINAQQLSPKPLLLKIAPDLTVEQLDDVIDLAAEIKLDGLVAANTSISRENLLTPPEQVQAIGLGGLSGKPLTKRATDMVRYISKRSNDVVPVIASGGIFTTADAAEKINAGAALLQVWTGFIYEGPGIVKKLICAAD